MPKGGSRNIDKDDRGRIISSDRRQTAYDRPVPSRRPSSNTENTGREGEHHYETPRTIGHLATTPRNSAPTVSDTTRDESHFEIAIRAPPTNRRIGNTALSGVPEIESGHDAHHGEQVSYPLTSAPSATAAPTMITRATTDIRPPSSLMENNTIQNLNPYASAFVRIDVGDFLACRNMIQRHPDDVLQDMQKYEIVAIQLYSQREDTIAYQCLQRYLLVRHCQTNRLSMQEIDHYLVKLSKGGTTYQNHVSDLKNVRTAVLQQTKAARAAKNPQSTYPVTQSRPITIPSQGRTSNRHASSALENPSLQSGSLKSDMQQLSISQNYGSSPRDHTQIGISNSMDSNTMSPPQPMVSAPSLSNPYRIRLESVPSFRPSAMSPASYGAAIGNQNPPPSLVNVGFASGLGNPFSQAHDFATGTTTSTSTHMPVATTALNTGHTLLMRSTSTATIGDDDDQPHELNLIRRDDDTITLPDDILPLVQGQQTKQYAGFNIKTGSKAVSFFVVGRVFRIYWASPAGSDLDRKTKSPMNTVSSSGTKKSSNPDSIHFKPRLMLVVQAKKSYCICCPIATYGGQGLRKYNHNNAISEQEIRAHAIIYTRGAEPVLLTNEPMMGKRPIAVDMVKGEQNLNVASRVHFGKFHTVEWNVHVKGIGMVHKDSIDDVEDYYHIEALSAVQSRARHNTGRAREGRSR